MTPFTSHMLIVALAFPLAPLIALAIKWTFHP